MPPRPRRTPSREGLIEYVLLAGFLALAAAGAVALFGDELRASLGVAPPGPARVQPAPGPAR